LANIENLVLESVEIDRKVLILITKVLPYFQHHIYTGFGISKDSYGDKSNEYRGIG